MQPEHTDGPGRGLGSSTAQEIGFGCTKLKPSIDRYLA